MISHKVFIASDGFVAFIDRAHVKHIHASAQFRYFAENNFQLYTTIVTINDVYNELSISISPTMAKDFLRAIELSNINILLPEESDAKRALRLITGNQISDLSFNSAVMAVMCNKRSIPQICTFKYLHSLFGLQTFYLPV
jgi:predicted nucleic acid-binding protein